MWPSVSLASVCMWRFSWPRRSTDERSRLAEVVDEASSFTGLVRPDSLFPCVPGSGSCKCEVEVDGPSEPVAPTVRTVTEIRVYLERGEASEEYTWTKAEAELIRDAINDALDTRPGYSPPVWPYTPNTYPTYPHSPWVSYNICHSEPSTG